MGRISDSGQENGRASWPMLSGGKNIHVIVPLALGAAWAEVRRFATSFCAVLAGAASDRFTVTSPNAGRSARILLNFLPNQRIATAVLPIRRGRVTARMGLLSCGISWTASSRLIVPQLGGTNTLLKRARSKAPRGWGGASQALPQLPDARGSCAPIVLKFRPLQQ
jgi:bifunctional non-homologous end joining protein LigD